jgi:NADPH2:quinone reductase
MKAVQLTGYEGLKSLQVVNVNPPKPGASEVLLQVKAAGINFAEIELTKGRYVIPKQPPFIMGFEASGVVAEVGSQVKNVSVGDKVTALVSSGGYAEYAIADASFAIPIPSGLSFAEAVTIPVQGISAYTLLKFAARPQPTESLLIQAAAGGVGLYLVQLAKLMGAGKVIALAGSTEKTDLVRSLGADVSINYNDRNWVDQVNHATGNQGVDIVLEAASGEIGKESFKLAAPFGRIVVFGAKNIHDTLTSEEIQQLIYKNQSLTGFNFPSLRPQQIAECIPDLLTMISQGKVKLFANHTFPLDEVEAAFKALSSRQTIGKVVLVP